MTDTVTVLYLGLTRPSYAADPRESFVALNEHGEQTDRKLFFKQNRKSFGDLRVGHVYDVPAEDDGKSFLFGRATHRYAWPDEGERMAIITANRAVESSMAAERRQDRMAKEDVNLDAIMAPLRRQYNKLNKGTDQVAFELVVLQALRKVR